MLATEFFFIDIRSYLHSLFTHLSLARYFSIFFQIYCMWYQLWLEHFSVGSFLTIQVNKVDIKCIFKTLTKDKQIFLTYKESVH